MCDDINATVGDLRAKGIEFATPIENQGFGLITRLKVPGAGELGLYEPGRKPRPSTCDGGVGLVVTASARSVPIARLRAQR